MHYENKKRFLKGKYTEDEFLRYYKFKDKDCFVPPRFYGKQNFYTNLIKNVVKSVKKGAKVKSAVVRHAEISPYTAGVWKRKFEQELSEGKTDTPLIRLFVAAYSADAFLEQDLAEIGIDMAKNGDGKMLQFLLKNRCGFKETSKKEVELSSKEDAPIKFVIEDMKPTDNEK